MRESAHGSFWTFEDDLGYYRILRANALEVYSQDIFVRHLSTWQMGVGGVVASKQPLEVDFARNAADSDCPVWSGFRRVIEALVIRELTTAKQLTDAQRKFLGIRFRRIAECVPDPGIWKGIKLLTDALGKHLPLCAVAHYTRFVHVPEAEALACAALGSDGAFVVTDALLDRFGVESLGEWLALMAEAGLLPEPRRNSSSARADLSSASAQTDNPSTRITL